MWNCDDVRERLAVADGQDDERVVTHLATCAACRSYRRAHSTLDAMLPSYLHLSVPDDLAARLLAIVDMPAATIAAPPPRPRAWVVAVAYSLTMLVVAVSLFIAFSLMSNVGEALGMSTVLAQVANLPSILMAEIAQTLPQSRSVVAFLASIHEVLLWVLAAVMMWIGLERAAPRLFAGAHQRRQRA